MTGQRELERTFEGTPIGKRIVRLRVEHAGQPVIATDVSLEDFKAGAAQHKWGAGASYVPLLKTVYGPPKNAASA